MNTTFFRFLLPLIAFLFTACKHHAPMEAMAKTEIIVSSPTYSWPTFNEPFNSVWAALNAMDEQKVGSALIFIMAHWHDTCQHTARYWQARSSPIPIYVVNFDSVPDNEQATLEERGVTSIPVCMWIVNGEIFALGEGWPHCSLGLQVMLDNELVQGVP